jgi:hypothetical protein
MKNEKRYADFLQEQAYIRDRWKKYMQRDEFFREEYIVSADVRKEESEIPPQNGFRAFFSEIIGKIVFAIFSPKKFFAKHLTHRK